MAPLWSFVGCKVRAREVPDPNANVPITVMFTEEEFDTDTMWSVTEPTRVTIRRPG